MAVAYDPSAQYETKVWDVEYRRDPVRTLMARIYQPLRAWAPSRRSLTCTEAPGMTRTVRLMRWWTNDWRQAVS